ncbi:MAG: cysteine desulfurase [Lewinellaceae bacterium]|nr:cysteine desulfurase [Lewinellaceae bacterium]
MARIYFDNAATTPLDPEVVSAMSDTLMHVYGNPSSIHAEGRMARTSIEAARKTVANAIGASMAEVFFTSCGTESNNMAIKCAVRDLGVRRIISSPTEHHCGTHAIEAVQKSDAVAVEWFNVDHQGKIDPAELDRLLAAQPGVKTLVTLMHANNEIGTMIDLEAVAAVCKTHDAYFHTDTVQTIGHFPINVSQTPIHFLAGSAHKFHGPKGIGFVYINSDVHINPFIDGGGQERNMRSGTENISGIVGLAKALDLAYTSMDERRAHISDLRHYMMERLSAAVPGLQFNGDYQGRALYTVLSVSFPPSPKNEMLILNLDIAGISASGGSACSSGAEKGSHVLEAIGADPDRKSVRFSFSHFNTKEEVDAVVEKVKGMV